MQPVCEACSGGADHDAEGGIATRQRLFDKITNEQLRIVGFHLPHGGIGRVDTSETGYRFVAEA